MRIHRPMGLSFLRSAIAAIALQFAAFAASAADSPIVMRFDGGFSDVANAIATDRLGNAYVGGEVESVDRKREFAVLKYGPDGTLLWTAKYSNAQHGTDAGAVRSIAVDAAGNVYAAGMVYTNVTLFTVNMDWLIVSYSSDGVERWSQRINGTANAWDTASEVALDNVGNVYVAGSIDDAATAGQSGWTLIKYSPTGAQLWRHTDVRDDGTRDGFAHMHFDAAANVIGVGTNIAVQAGAQHKVVTTKVDASGSVIWRRLFSDTALSDDIVTDMDVDANDNIYLTGETVASTNPELQHVPITLKYDAGGTLQFLLRGDGAGGESIAVDPFGDLVVSGSSLRESGVLGLAATAKYDALGNRKWLASGVTGNLSVDGVGNIYAFTSVQLFTTNNSDLQTTKLNSDGGVVWQHRFNGAFTTTNASSDQAIASSVDPFGNLFTVSTAQDGSLSDIVTLRYAANVIPQQLPTSINAPSNLSASAASGRVSLLWNDNSNNEAAFSIERCLGKTCTNFAQLIQLAANTTSYIDSSVAKNSTYRYRLRAVNGTTNSPYSNIATITTQRK